MARLDCAGMCLLSLATVGLSSVLSILKLLYLLVQEVPSSQLRRESFELCASEYTRSQRIKETFSFTKEKMILKEGARGVRPHSRLHFGLVSAETWGKAKPPSPHSLQR